MKNGLIGLFLIIIVGLFLIAVAVYENEEANGKKFVPIRRDCGSSNYTDQTSNSRADIAKCQKANWQNLEGMQFTAEPSIFKIFYDEKSGKEFDVIEPEVFTIEEVKFKRPDSLGKIGEEIEDDVNEGEDYDAVFNIKFQSGKSANLYIKALPGLSLTGGLSTSCRELNNLIEDITFRYCVCK
jgi:hypothetical protein